MAKRLFYFAKPIYRRAGIPVGGDAMPFLSAVDAEEGGRLLARLADGVIVYQQMGDPEHDLWDEPETLAIVGSVSRSLAVALAA